MRSTGNTVAVDIGELLEAIEWVSGGAGFGNAAYIRRHDGRSFWTGDGIEEPDGIPEDVEDGTRYLAVPGKQELGLGKPLALRFAEEYLSSDVGEVHVIFSRRGAYQRFKELLDRRNRLEEWYRFEASETKDAVVKWAREHGLEVRGPEPKAADA